MSAIEELQDWYGAQCNGDWEHLHGVTIESLDAPGWQVTIDLAETNLAGVAFPSRAAVDPGEGRPRGDDWVRCEVQKDQFIGRGGPAKLGEILTIFLSWAKSSARERGP
jgi:hypothetical protein